MKTILLSALTLSALVLSGCASQGELNKANIQLKTLEERITAVNSRAEQLEKSRVEERSLDLSRFCFSNNLAYSEGSILAGRICQRQAGLVVYQDGKHVVQPLVWNHWKYQ
jgi:outer membrane murein-binding lipoprotein Lpp